MKCWPIAMVALWACGEVDTIGKTSVRTKDPRVLELPEPTAREAGGENGAHRQGIGCPDGDLDGVTVCDGDCHDGDPTIYPGATEICDGIDQDCDWVIDEGFDLDGDGFSTCGGDCADADPAVHPNAIELCDGRDNDCDGATDEGFDADGDGFTSCGGDCADTDPAIHPRASERCDTIDNDCDGAIDEGGVCAGCAGDELAVLDHAGGRLLLYSSTGQHRVCAAGLSLPIDVAVGPAGDFYVTEHGTARILRVDAACSTVDVVHDYFATGLVPMPWDLAFDAGGALHVTDRIGGAVWRLGTTPSLLVSGLVDPVAISWGPDGLLYVANLNGFEIRRFDAAGLAADARAWIDTSAGFTDITGIVHGCGGLYFAANDDNQLWACPGDASTCGPIAATLPFEAPQNPFDLALDCNCDLYTSASGQSQVQWVPAAAGNLTVFADTNNGITPSSFGPTGIAVRR